MQLEVVLWSLDVYYYSFQCGTGSLGPFCLTCLAWDQGRRPWSHSQTTGCTFNLIIRVKHCLLWSLMTLPMFCPWQRWGLISVPGRAAEAQGIGHVPSQATPSFPWTADPCSPESLCHPATCWILKSPHQAWWFLPGFWLHLSGFLRFPTHKIWYVHICPGSQIIPGQIWASALQTAQNPQPMTPAPSHLISLSLEHESFPRRMGCFLLIDAKSYSVSSEPYWSYNDIFIDTCHIHIIHIYRPRLTAKGSAGEWGTTTTTRRTRTRTRTKLTKSKSLVAQRSQFKSIENPYLRTLTQSSSDKYMKISLPAVSDK